jgi:hypothetical protein
MQIVEEIDDEEENVYASKEEDVVTPYSICNKTNVNLLVKRLTNLHEEEKD